MGFLTYPVTDTQKELLTLVSQLADTFAQRALLYDWEGHFPLENFEDMHRANLLALPLPHEFGGHGAPLTDVLSVVSLLAQGDGSTALVIAMHYIYVVRLLNDQAQTSPLIRRVYQDIVENGALINSAISEPATGSPSRGGLPQTTARRLPDGSWSLNGRKTFTTGSHALHYIIVGCRVEEDDVSAPHAERGGDGTRRNFLLHRSASGLSIKDTWNSVGMRETASNDLLLTDVHVPAEAFLDGAVFPAPESSLSHSVWTLLVPAVYLGIAQAARNEAIRFASQRHPNSLREPISTLAHIQEKVGKMDLALLESKAVLFGLAEQFEADPESMDLALCGAAKYIVTNHAIEIVDLAMRIVGAASLALTSPLQRYYRDVRAGLHNPPMDDAVLASLAKKAFSRSE